MSHPMPLTIGFTTTKRTIPIIIPSIIPTTLVSRLNAV